MQNATNQLSLMASEKFGTAKADIYCENEKMFMTARQLSECLGYANVTAISKILNKCEYLKKEKFSVIAHVQAKDGKTYPTRLFTEDGIYEITMLSKTKKAAAFREWIREILKNLRQGIEVVERPRQVNVESDVYKIIDSALVEARQRIAEQIEQANLLKLQAPVAKANKPSDEAILSMCNNFPNGNSWRRWVNAMISMIIASSDEERNSKDVLKEVYSYIRSVYGFVVEQEIRDYREQRGISGKVSALTVIEADSQWRAIFSTALIDRLHNNLPKNLAEKYSTPADAVCDKPEHTRRRRNQMTPREAIAELSSKSGKTLNKVSREVYGAMNVNWKNRTTRYMHKKHTKVKPTKLEMVTHDERLRKEFFRVVNHLT